MVIQRERESVNLCASMMYRKGVFCDLKKYIVLVYEHMVAPQLAAKSHSDKFEGKTDVASGDGSVGSNLRAESRVRFRFHLSFPSSLSLFLPLHILPFPPLHIIPFPPLNILLSFLPKTFGSQSFPFRFAHPFFFLSVFSQLIAYRRHQR